MCHSFTYTSNDFVIKNHKKKGNGITKTKYQPLASLGKIQTDLSLDSMMLNYAEFTIKFYDEDGKNILRFLLGHPIRGAPKISFLYFLNVVGTHLTCVTQGTKRSPLIEN